MHSLASGSRGGFVELCVRRIPGVQCSGFLHALQPGASIAAFLHVLEHALQVCRASGGAFDPGVGALVDAWGFGATRDTPDAAAIHRAAQVPRTAPRATARRGRWRWKAPPPDGAVPTG